MEELWTPLPKSLAKRIERMAALPEGQSEARLPSQRELALQLGVSRTSVREALSSLEASGKVRTEPGRGCYWISAEPSESGAQPVSDTTGQLPQRTYPKSEISRLRYLVEGQSARLAAMRITNRQIEQLEKTLTTFKAQTRAMDLEASAKTDFQFHHLIIAFSGVSLFRDLHIAFRDVIMLAVRMYRSQYSRAWEPVSEHEKILEALRRRDPDEAVYYSQSHIVRSADRLGIIDSSEIL